MANRKVHTHLLLWNSHAQLQSEGKQVADLWAIVASGSSEEHAIANGNLRRWGINHADKTRYVVIVDSPETRAKYGNPRAV